MRKILIVSLSICLLFISAVSVSADVIWEPYNDSFYDKHSSEMQYEGRFYRMQQTVSLYSRPDGRQLDGSLQADEEVCVQYTYQSANGQLWGIIYHSAKESAWVNLDGSLKLYDRNDFRSDYKSELSPIETQPDAAFYDTDVVLYDYPGAAREFGNLYVQQDADYLPEYTHSYTDPAGNVWAELYYYMGQKGWVLLSGDITTVQRPAKAVDTVIGSAATQTEQMSSSDENTVLPGAEMNYTMPVLLVAAVVAVTLAVLFVFLKKKKEGR